jgi:hypothetical protein
MLVSQPDYMTVWGSILTHSLEQPAEVVLILYLALSLFLRERV